MKKTTQLSALLLLLIGIGFHPVIVEAKGGLTSQFTKAAGKAGSGSKAVRAVASSSKNFSTTASNSYISRSSQASGAGSGSLARSTESTAAHGQGSFARTQTVNNNRGLPPSTLHERGTKISGGRTIEGTIPGSNKIKNANGDVFKRVDYPPSKPHGGLSPHTHPNYRNQLPDGTIKTGVSRHAQPVTRKDITDAARKSGQRTGGL